MSDRLDHVWYVRIDGWQPTRQNKLLKCHEKKRARLKRHDAIILRLAVLGAGVPAADLPRRVSLQISLGPRQRGFDPDDFWNPLIEGLVACGALKDESELWCRRGDVLSRKKKRPGVVVRLEDLPFTGEDCRPQCEMKKKPRCRKRMSFKTSVLDAMSQRPLIHD